MIDEHLESVERLRRDGAVVLLKWDGERSSKVYTVVILQAQSDYAWRRDTDDISRTLQEGIAAYDLAQGKVDE